MPMFRKLVPMLQTKNMGQTIGWYEKVLGFQQTSPQVSGWCCLSRDGVSIMFMDNAHLGSPHATATQYFTVDDVDALWDDVKRYCQAEWGPEDMSYGLREFAIKDPNGYFLSFGSPITTHPSSN
jgi:uncharacterized glyoxalase superfamily protein PhnB